MNSKKNENIWYLCTTEKQKKKLKMWQTITLITKKKKKIKLEVIVNYGDEIVKLFLK